MDQRMGVIKLGLIFIIKRLNKWLKNTKIQIISLEQKQLYGVKSLTNIRIILRSGLELARLLNVRGLYITNKQSHIF
jgi:2-succinyl-5-enolpyruvyl-6-hydroxy-3-cyclohexene-1-carboxylate synthase